MKRVELIFDESNEAEMEMILRQCGVEYYTRFHGVTGVGQSGAKLGNSTGPGINSFIIAYVEADSATRLIAAVDRFMEVCRQNDTSPATRCIVSTIEEFL